MAARSEKESPSSEAVEKAGDPPGRRKRGRPRNLVPSDEYVARQEQIVSAAADVFRERGYEAGSLDDVALALDLRKASLYYYVKSKSELLYLIFDRAISVALKKLEELKAIADPRARLSALIRHQATLVASDPSLFAVFFDQRPGLSDDHLEEMLAKEREYVREYVDAVAVAMTADVLPRGDVRMTAHAVLGMTNWTYKWFDPARDDIDAYAELCVRLLVGPDGERGS